MGYRSDVRIAFYGSKEAVCALLTRFRMEHGDDYAKYIKPDMNVFELNDDTVCVAFEFNDVKWYDDYDDVKVFSKLYSMAIDLSDEGSDLSGELVRIGEDIGDATEDHFGECQWVYRVVKCIECDCQITNNPQLLGIEV